MENEKKIQTMQVVKKKTDVKVVCDTHSPFTACQSYKGQKNFDKYYIDREVKEVFVKTGVDENGDEIGVVKHKIIDHKIDISEFLESQRDTVGVESYIRALGVQGVDIADCSTVIDDKINDFSECPDTLADTLMIGDRAKEAFANLDPELKGNHTTLEGFLSSLSPETLEKFYKQKLGVVDTPKEGD